MSPYRRNILVGVLVLGALLIFIWMIVKFSSKTADIFAPPQMALRLHTTRADGLSDGSAVFYLGVNVGRVVSVTRTMDGTGVVIDTMVDRNPPIPANIRAVISQSGLLGGGSTVNLDIDGDKALGALSANTSLDAKYVGLQLNLLPPSVTQTADQIGQMSDEIRKMSLQLRTSDVVSDLDGALKQINAQAVKAGKMIDSMQEIMGDPQTRDNVKLAVADLRTTSQATTRISTKLDALTDSLQHNSDQIGKQVGDRLTQMSAILANVQSITDKVDKGKGTAGQLVNDPRLYESLVDSTRQLSVTVADLHRLINQWEQEGVHLSLK
ncbi:MAG: MlaD family protein [Planctomycetota bacterium]|nr:MlaD family protein [Planctomycetota bacterium]